MKSNPITATSLLTVMCVWLAIPASAPAQSAFRIGGAGNDYGKDLTVDSAGNIVSTGYFNGTVDFNPTATVSNLTALGISDNYVAKYTLAGSLLWAFRTGGTAAELPHSVVLDGSDNIYLAGYFSTTTDFDPGLGVASRTSAGGRDAYVAKYSSTGAFNWVNTFGGTTDDEAFDLRLDSSGNVYATGMFQGTVNAGGGNLVSNGGQDVFFAKFDNGGNHLWSYSMGGVGDDQGYTVRTDSLGNAWLAGAFAGTNVNFGAAGSVTNLTSAGQQDIFLAKYTPGGTNLFAGRMGGLLDDNPAPGGMVVDSTNSVYITGSFRGIADMNPGPALNTLTNAGNADIFVAKYGTNGAMVYAFRAGGAGLDGGHRMVVDGNDNLYVTGWVVGTNNVPVDFDPGLGVGNVVPLGTNANNVFLASYDKNGAYRYAGVMGDANSDTNNASIGGGLGLTSDGQIIMGGRMYGTMDFDPSTGIYNLTSAGGSDIFIAQYNAATGQLVPEPGSGVLTLAGFAGLVFVLHRRRTVDQSG
ncbi:MAG: hypothetical protein NTY01_08035 [Verrucomicrobia bacterium]|nr:hypothetical protein [Verrucomicrobiota bacterium]